MNQQTKRIVNAFLITFLGVLLVQAINSWADITNALQTGDWGSLKQVGIAAVAAAVVAGLRALQSFVPKVPSPEPDESETAKEGGTTVHRKPKP